MKTILAFIAFLLVCTTGTVAASAAPDTVKTGIYVTSIHDINFKDKEYTLTCWLWLKYKNRDFDFIHNLEIPQAKTFTTAFSTIDTTGDLVYVLMKLQCIMKDSWKIDDFPFDQQKLRFSIENSQFDNKALVFVPDAQGAHFDKRFTLRGWAIDSFKMSVGTKIYETAFGDANINIPHTEYSAFKVVINITRNATALFWKLFLGMYVAFFIAYVCFYIHADSIDSRFGLSVGALFAVIGNKYIVDSALPESITYTLVDTLHGVTLVFMLLIIMSNAYSLTLIKKEKSFRSRRFDMVTAQVILIAYLLINVYFISKATKVF